MSGNAAGWLGFIIWLAASQAPGQDEPKRVVVMDENGRRVVARVYGQEGNETAVLMPSGELRFVRGAGPMQLAYTERPFQPLAPEELCENLQGQYPGQNFNCKTTKHYVILYNCSEPFAVASANLLESLYEGLLKAFGDRGLPVKEAEFPLPAIIFRKESEFRARRPIESAVQAYYEVNTNQIVFYETSENDANSPEIAAMRKPQTVAHEGTHQILQNIGVQPRLSPWPIWLVEGLAEYCAPTTTKKAAAWAGLGKVNAIHMATIKDLSDPIPAAFREMGVAGPKIERDPKQPLSGHLVTRSDLNASEYAYTWAMTHYLATKKASEFNEYLKRMALMRPLEKRTPEDQLKLFQETFGRDLFRLDKDVSRHLTTLKYEELPYYAVVFEHLLPDGRLRRAGLITQSPSVIRQRYEQIRDVLGNNFNWRVVPCPSRKRAALVVDQMLAG